MKTRNINSSISSRLEEIGAQHISHSLRKAIIDDITKDCVLLVAKKVTREYVGEMFTKTLLQDYSEASTLRPTESNDSIITTELNLQ